MHLQGEVMKESSNQVHRKVESLTKDTKWECVNDVFVITFDLVIIICNSIKHFLSYFMSIVNVIAWSNVFCRISCQSLSRFCPIPCQSLSRLCPISCQSLSRFCPISCQSLSRFCPISCQSLSRFWCFHFDCGLFCLRKLCGCDRTTGDVYSS
jgi:hypothetical protein